MWNLLLNERKSKNSQKNRTRQFLAVNAQSEKRRIRKRQNEIEIRNDN